MKLRFNRIENTEYRIQNKVKVSLLASALLFLIMASTFAVKASVPYNLADSATNAYNKGNFAKAITFYRQFVNSGYESPDVYYNMGNCYYRTNDIARAILYYEKAKKLSPDDADVQFNLQIANQKVTDKIPGGAQIFLSNWWSNFVNLQSEKGWAITCILLLCSCLALIILYLLSHSLLLRQLGFWTGILMFILCLFSFILAREQYAASTAHDAAIVMSASVTVKGSPTDNGTQLFVIHEGTKVKIIKSEGEWTEVKLSNGNQGWLLTSDIEAI